MTSSSLSELDVTHYSSQIYCKTHDESWAKCFYNCKNNLFLLGSTTTDRRKPTANQLILILVVCWFAVRVLADSRLGSPFYGNNFQEKQKTRDVKKVDNFDINLKHLQSWKISSTTKRKLDKRRVNSSKYATNNTEKVCFTFIFAKITTVEY